MAGRPKLRAERLDEASIVNAALAVAQDNVDNLTMRSVSEALQVSVGALYKHVAGRDALIALVVEKILSQAPPTSANGGDGWLALRAQVLGVQALVDLYPGMDEMVVAHSPNSPKANELRREGIAALQAEGLTLDQAMLVYRAVTYLWLGARVAAKGRARNHADIDTFALALDVLLSGLKENVARRNEATSIRGV
jgi:AcrR family transcriptional regulator